MRLFDKVLRSDVIPVAGLVMFIVALLTIGQCAKAEAELHADTTEDWAISAITECENNIPYEKAKVLGSDNYYNTGMTAVDLDTNGDGEVDVTALYNTAGAPPLFWIVDLDLDGFADAVYVDPKGDGDCSHIVLYCEMGKQNCPLQGPMDWRT